jgi:hypothetical protein
VRKAEGKRRKEKAWILPFAFCLSPLIPVRRSGRFAPLPPVAGSSGAPERRRPDLDDQICLICGINKTENWRRRPNFACGAQRDGLNIPVAVPESDPYSLNSVNSLMVFWQTF